MRSEAHDYSHTRILRRPKRCGCCGRVYGIVVGGRVCEDGNFWFDCEECGSTMIERFEDGDHAV